MGESSEQQSFGGIPVDPRVEWAMHVMDTEGHEFTPWFDKLMIPAMGASMPLIALMVKNGSSKLPMKTNMPLMLLAMPAGWWMAKKTYDWKQAINAENMALARHYILTHPERFPEPKSHKYKDMILPWLARR